MAVSMVASKGSNSTRMLNPWVLHLQKLGLELKCPLCLEFFVRPMLLPCNHIFCHGCLPDSSQLAMPCLLCQKQYACGDIRPAPFMENLVSIYTSLDATFYANLPQNVQSVGVRVLKQCAVSPVNEAAKVSAETGQEVVGNGQVKESDKFGMELKSSSGFERSNQSTISTSLGNAEVLDVRIAEMDMNHVENSSQGSPSGHSSDPSKNQTPSNCSSKRLAKEVHDNSTSSKRFNGCTLEIEGFVKELKRQKQMADESPSQMFMETDFDRYNTESDKLLNSSAKVLDANCISNFICGFCLSSTVSEDTGEMLHYVNGHPVTDETAGNTDVVHVHRKCFEWSPQGYFEGDTVKNLEKELARGAKLKCCRCGLKGAALGCYAKSCRRTYHVPCAAQVSKCRWDCDNYLMLCPAHASLRFPSEKSNRSSKRPSALNRKASHTEQSLLWDASFSGAKDWVLCGSALAADDKYLLMKFATKTGATVSKTWTPDVTHVIAATDEQGACTRTFKVLMAVLHGRWVLKMNWIRACMKATQAVGEEPYEVRVDNHGCCNGSKLGRLRVSNNDPKLFTGLKFYFVGEIAPSFANDLEELILAAGGGVVESKESLMQQRNDPTTAKTLIVYNPEPQEGCLLGEELSMYWQKLNEAEELAASSGSQIINHAWLLESIAACKLQPLINLATTTPQ